MISNWTCCCIRCEPLCFNCLIVWIVRIMPSLFCALLSHLFYYIRFWFHAFFITSSHACSRYWNPTLFYYFICRLKCHSTRSINQIFWVAVNRSENNVPKSDRMHFVSQTTFQLIMKWRKPNFTDLNFLNVNRNSCMSLRVPFNKWSRIIFFAINFWLRRQSLPNSINLYIFHRLQLTKYCHHNSLIVLNIDDHFNTYRWIGIMINATISAI